MKLTLAATVATAAASLAYASAFGVSRRRSSSSNYCISTIPPEILQSDCREEVILAVRLALEGKFLEMCGFLCCLFVHSMLGTSSMHIICTCLLK